MFLNTEFLKSHYIIILLMFLSFQNSNAQEKMIDTLDQFLQKQSISDSIKLDRIHKLIWSEVLFSNPDEAFKVAQKQYDFARKVNDLNYQAKALNTQGVSYNLRSEYDKAISYYLQSIEIRKIINDKRGVANTLSNIGLSQKEKGDYNSAIQNFTESLKIQEELKNKQGQATALNNIGIIYLDQNNYVQAKEYFTNGLKLYREVNDIRGMTLVLTNLGLSHINIQEYDAAMTCFQQSLTLHNKLSDQDGLARTFGFIAEVYYLQQQYDNAMEFQLESLELRKEIGDKSGVSESLTFIANIHFGKNEFELARINGEESLEIAKKIGGIRLIQNATESLSKTYKALGRFESSLDMYNRYIVLRDSINSEENHREIVRQELMYKYEKQKVIDDIETKRKIGIAEKEREKTILLLIMLSIGTLVISLFLFFIYKRYQLINKQKSTIESQYQSIEEKTEKIIQIEKEKHEHELLMKRKDMEAVVANNNLQIKLKEDLQSSLRLAQKSENVNNEIQKIIIDLNLQIETQKKLNLMEANIQEVNAKFFNELLELHPDISKTEKEICAYIKLGLSTKEIAALRNTTTNTINVTKTRLRKKLGLESNSEINIYLAQY